MKKKIRKNKTVKARPSKLRPSVKAISSKLVRAVKAVKSALRAPSCVKAVAEPSSSPVALPANPGPVQTTPAAPSGPTASELEQCVAKLSSAEAEALQEEFKTKELTRERIERKLKQQFGFEKDELKVLFASDSALLDFYLKEAKQVASAKPAEDESADQEDAYKLTRSNLREVEELDLLEKRAHRRKSVQLADAIAAKTDPAAAQKHAQLQEQLPPEARVSYEDMIASMKAGLSLEKDDEQN